MSNPLLDALRDNMRENNNDLDAWDRHEEERNQHARPYDCPTNVWVPPQELNPDGSLKETKAAKPAAKPAKPVREGAEADVWLNVPDELLKLLDKNPGE